MSYSRQHSLGRRDKNEREIIEEFKAQGCKVWQLTEDGIPDLLILKGCTWLLVEVKGEKGKLTKKQRIFFNKVPDEAPLFVCRDPGEVKGILRKA